MLDEATEGFGVSGQAVLGGGDEHAGAEVAFVVLAAEGVHLPGALEEDILALVPIWIESVEGALHNESGEADENRVLFSGLSTYLRYIISGL